MKGTSDTSWSRKTFIWARYFTMISEGEKGLSFLACIYPKDSGWPCAIHLCFFLQKVLSHKVWNRARSPFLHKWMGKNKFPGVFRGVKIKSRSHDFFHFSKRSEISFSCLILRVFSRMESAPDWTVDFSRISWSHFLSLLSLTIYLSFDFHQVDIPRGIKVLVNTELARMH